MTTPSLFEFPTASDGVPTMNRRALLRTIGMAGLGLGAAGSTLLGNGGGSFLGLLGGDPADASTACPSGSKINQLRVFAANLNTVLIGTTGADAMGTDDGGATFRNYGTVGNGSTYIPYCAGSNGVAGSFGIGCDRGWVFIYDAPANVWRSARPGGSTTIFNGLAGNGANWVAVSVEGKFWYTTNNGASWSAPSNGGYLNYKSIASILTCYDLEYANGVWVGCGYDTLGVGRTFWRSTQAVPTRGAKNSWFSVVGGDFSEAIGSGDGNAVSVYGVAYGGSCQANPNTWYGCGNFGTVWRSTDNGGSWSKFRDSGSHIHYNLDVNPYTGKILCASGLGGIMEVNPGMVQRYNPGANEIYEIAYCGANDWVASGDNGQIFVSHDDGVSWLRPTQVGGSPANMYNTLAKTWS